MTETIRFTRHAREKLSLLARHGFIISEKLVVETVLQADRFEVQNAERIAQKVVTDTHVLRVVFRTEEEQIVIITFYPGRRKRYESEV